MIRGVQVAIDAFGARRLIAADPDGPFIIIICEIQLFKVRKYNCYFVSDFGH